MRVKLFLFFGYFTLCITLGLSKDAIARVDVNVKQAHPAPLIVDVPEASDLTPVVRVKTTPVVAAVSEADNADVSYAELSVGVKGKKFELSGIGLNAHTKFSTGTAINFKYYFAPVDRSWSSLLEAEHSTLTIKDLAGLNPTAATLSESRLTYGVNYLLHNFSIGPVLMYEMLSTTLTSPSIFRGNINFLNAGMSATFSRVITTNFKINLNAKYLTKIMSESKTTAIGVADKHILANFSAKLYYELKSWTSIFIGIGYLRTNTQYSNSPTRGTSQAVEKESEFTFPVGINYAF